MSTSGCVEVAWSDDDSSDGDAEPVFEESDGPFEPVVEAAPSSVRRSRRKVMTPVKVEWLSSDESSDDDGNGGQPDHEELELQVKTEEDIDGTEEATVVVLTQAPENMEEEITEPTETEEPEPVPAKRPVGRPRKRRVLTVPHKRHKKKSAIKKGVTKSTNSPRAKRKTRGRRQVVTQDEASVPKRPRFNKDDDLPCQCVPCGKVLKNFREVLKHQKEHIGLGDASPSYACLQCKKQFRGKRGLREHKRTHSDLRPYACEECGKAFYHANSLRRHKMTHQGEPQFQCQVCNKRFYERDPCRRHMEHHAATRDHVCDICGQKFLTSLTLKRHHIVHRGGRPEQVKRSSGVRPYQCDACGASFTRSSDLKIHFTAMHTDEKPYSCDLCGKEFARSGSLWVHKKTHAERKAYTCEYCGKSYSQAGYLVEHRRIHTNDRRYQCEVCNKTFVWSGNLREHKKTHLGEKQRCPVCLKEISICTSMAKHLRKMHGISTKDVDFESLSSFPSKGSSAKKEKASGTTTVDSPTNKEDDMSDSSHIKQEKPASQPRRDEGPISSSVQLPVTVETIQSVSVVTEQSASCEDVLVAHVNNSTELEPGEIISAPVQVENVNIAINATNKDFISGNVVPSVPSTNESRKPLSENEDPQMDRLDNDDKYVTEAMIKMDHNVTLMPQQDADIPELIYFQDTGL